MAKRTVRKGDFLIMTPEYTLTNYPDHDDLDPSKFHLCEATAHPYTDGTFAFKVIATEDTQAMCEALAHSMFGGHRVWIPK